MNFKQVKFWILCVVALVFGGCLHHKSGDFFINQKIGNVDFDLLHPVDLKIVAAGQRSNQNEHFFLKSYVEDSPKKNGCEVLRIYLEGDGKAWENKTTPSLDPTPTDKLTLTLALQDLQQIKKGVKGDMIKRGARTRCVAYLARPCQFLKAKNGQCQSNQYWTSARYSAQVVALLNGAIDALKKQYGVKKIQLFGYSGGGVLAMFVGADRYDKKVNDVELITTIAGFFDHDFWTAHHRVSPLEKSLKMKGVIPFLRNTKQIHYVGGRDKIVPREVSRQLFEQMVHNGDHGWLKMNVIDGATHANWYKFWPELLGQIEG